MAKVNTTEIIDLWKFKSANLPELQGKKESIAEVIKNNPIKDIVDNASYEDMKKSRTAVKTLRTGLEKESKEVIGKLKTIVIDSVKTEYDSLIADVKSAEEERQSKVDVWEEKKEQERLEKARLEQERIDGIKNKINSFFEFQYEKLSDLNFDGIDSFKSDFESTVSQIEIKSFDEFEVLWDSKLADFRGRIIAKIQTLTEQEQIRIDNLLIQEKNSEQSRIQEWQRTWNSNIDSLSFGDISDVKSILVKSKLANLKHYVSGYEEIYLSTEKRLNSQIEFVSKAEEQRIAQEKFEKERKEFEEKQTETKFQERKKFLVDEDYWRIYLSAECGGKEGVVKEMLLTYTDSAFEDFKLAVLKAKEPIEEIEVVADEVVEFPAIDHVDPINVLPPNTTNKIEEIANNDAFIQEVEFEETWDSIYSEYETALNSQNCTDVHFSFLMYLNANYNVPTKKNNQWQKKK
jgi:hypothetical protein